MMKVSPPFTDELAEQLAAVASQVSGVDHLDGGRFGETSTYLATGIIRGVSQDIDTGHVKVAIVAQWPHPLWKVAAAVRQALALHVATPIDVYINDLVVPPSESTS